MEGLRVLFAAGKSAWLSGFKVSTVVGLVLMGKKLFAVAAIPAFNEERTIARTRAGDFTER